ncbi:endonuclease VIII [Shouchella lehensis]|uniref:DNA-(apurinic or apyrimidinic site) lyase n=1 Tax=Shouchella lehensis G1 TaxID=1246626 RepID=A0A060M766_9BACI|nr:endonuclease VIII [Shouchella lehensis]AIC96398.1 Endonuclease 8 [Shouchella lehensis G1]
MPEGPEIRRAAFEVEQAVKGQTLVEVYFAFPHLKEHEDHLVAAKVEAVRTKGKAMLIHFSNGYSIYSHNQLYGKWMIRKAFTYPTTKRQLRLALYTEKKAALLYSASDIEVLKTDELINHPFIAKAGPDVLSDDVTESLLLERMQSSTFKNRSWSALLLDQGFVAGNGNYLRSELLYVAGISPDAKPSECSDEQQHAMAEALITLSERSYETEGITVSHPLANELRNAGKKRRDYRHYVFNREGKLCYACGETIVKVTKNGRRLYYCPYCQ